MELRAGDRLGKYEIIARLAAGGMAEVYLARHVSVGGFAKDVAIKRMLPDLAGEPGFREMFMFEASLASRLSHNNIVQIFDFAEERGELYLAMEFIHGATLRQVLRDIHAPPSMREIPNAKLEIGSMFTAHVGRGIAKALAHAWEAADEHGVSLRLIHRDVSPHNILLSHGGDVKLADFGIAKPVDHRTSVGTIKGKLVYMSPEQITGGSLDARTDIFALGIVLYETGMNMRHALFDAPDQRAIMKAVHERLIPAPERMVSDFPKSLSRIILKALERDPEKRFQSAAEMAEALGECIHQEARSPVDGDVGRFMKEIYGEKQPVISARPASPAPRPVGFPPAVSRAPANVNRSPAQGGTGTSELDRRGNDPHGRTLDHAGFDAARARGQKEKSGDGTLVERRARRGSAARSKAYSDAPSESGARDSRRFAWTGMTVTAALAFGVSGLFFGARSTSDRREAPRAEMPAPASEPAPASPPSQAVVSALPTTNGVVPTELPLSEGRLLAGRPEAGNSPIHTAAPLPDPVVLPMGKAASTSEGPLASATGEVVVPKKPVRRTPVGKGSVLVQIVPWAFVAIGNGPKEEVSPARVFENIPAGTHSVELSNDSGYRRKLKVVVRANERARIYGGLDDAKQVPDSP